MKWTAMSGAGTPGPGVWAAVITLALTTMLFVVPNARAQEDNARKILKAMSDYVTSQKSVSATFDADIEVVTPDLQKIQFTSSGQFLMSRPNGLRASRAGGYSDVELVFDGTTATVLGRHNNMFAQIQAPGSVDQLIDRLRDDFNVAIPGADLLLARVYDQLTEDVLDVKYIGHGVIDGVDVEHLAFRGPEVDWQLWVEIGSRPIPRKYVITSKTVTAAPQYTLRIKGWTENPSVGADAFAFKAPAGAKKVDAKELTDIDEIPAGVVIGGKK